MRHLGRRSFLFLFMRDGTWAFAIIFSARPFFPTPFLVDYTNALLNRWAVAMVLNAVLYKLCTNSRAGMGYL